MYEHLHIFNEICKRLRHCPWQTEFVTDSYVVVHSSIDDVTYLTFSLIYFSFYEDTALDWVFTVFF